MARVNPFNEVYVTETISPTGFIELFSPLLIPDTLPLFQSGNVLMTGVQGSGKSMLLSLLKPEIRIAYARADTEFPLPKEFSRFIGAGINLTRSGISIFGERPIEHDEEGDLAKLPGYFADFMNYWIVRDILKSVDALGKALEGRLSEELGLAVQPKKLDGFAAMLARELCWCGFLDGMEGYNRVFDRIVERLSVYTDFLNYNIDELPAIVKSTRTTIGEPVSRTSMVLRECGVIPRDLPLLIRIDQHEELLQLEEWSEGQGRFRHYRGVVNKLIVKRDPLVSYKIGTRPYALESTEDAQVYGGATSLEELRNYKTIEFDELLRRRENRKTWLFPRFAEDVFRRRLDRAGLQVRNDRFRHIRAVFRYRFDAKTKAAIYAGSERKAILNCGPKWKDELKLKLESLAEEAPLSAILGEAWIRQQLRRKNPVLPTEDSLPWEEKKWWVKERSSVALLQIAARRRQRLLWGGEEEILTLSGGNVLAFLSICQQVWGAWLRSLPPDETTSEDMALPLIDDIYIQTEGIEEASAKWYRKIRRSGDWLQRVAMVIGEIFRRELRDDNSMSYPGHNGFSLSEGQLNMDAGLRKCLETVVAYGVLYTFCHRPKSTSSGERTKFYLNPILSPRFQVPAPHTKEPMYVSRKTVRRWLGKAMVYPAKGEQDKGRKVQSTNEDQLSLFG